MKEQPVKAVRYKGIPEWIYITDYAGHNHLKTNLDAKTPDYIRYALWIPLEIDETRVYNAETGEMEQV